MKVRFTRASTIIAAALLIASGAVAPAGAAEDCGLAELKTQTELTDSFKNERDKSGLVTKVTNAIQKFTQHKYQDSADKLGDYIFKVEALTERNKIIEEDGMSLIAKATEVRVCVLSK
jgi:hypothetical protein